MKTARAAMGTALSAIVLAILVRGASPPAAHAGPETPAERAVWAAESDPSKVADATKKVAEAILAEPRAVKPRVLRARLLLIEAKTKKTADRGPAFKAVLDALADAEAVDRWDPEPLVFRVDVLQEMGNADHVLLQETLRGIAIRKPGDEAARRAYVRIAGDVPMLAPGDPFPLVEWRDSQGKPVPAKSLWGQGRPVVVELYRSAVWCPFCMRQLLALDDAADAFAREGVTVVAASPDTPETIASIERDGLKGRDGVKDRKPYRIRLLSDTKGYTADALGFLNPETVRAGVRPEAYGLPFPTTIIVDNMGIVRFVKTHRDFRERVKTEEMVAIAHRIRVETTPDR